MYFYIIVSSHDVQIRLARQNVLKYHRAMTDLLPIIQQRISKCASELGESARSISTRAGLSYAAITNIDSGRSSNPGINTLARLAAVLGTTVGYLIGETDDKGKPIAAEQKHIEVIGTIQAGVWREAFAIDEDPETIPVLHDPRFPNVRQYGLRVAGDSMNMVAPAGSTAIFADFYELGIELKDGLRAHVECRKNDGQLVETTMKTIHRGRGNFELHPESTNTDHKVITLDSFDEENEEVRVLGILIDTYQQIRI